ncbi:PucR family transcriptional regulator [Thalassolituus sp. LLYu03]|uniref:PucR family transcriptional regulator n=1 Tax=Thalassolituus sp. LLYu03 TaxID=3421656 RepID=UPI003D2E53BC
MELAVSTRRRWPNVPERILDLMRTGAELALQLATSPQVLDELEAGNFGEADKLYVDPVLSAKQRRAIRAGTIHWLNGVIAQPDQPVSAFLVEEAVLGINEVYPAQAAQLLLSNARSVQDIAWQYWMKIAFQLTQNPLELQQLLEISSVSISTFIDDSLQLGLARMQQDVESRKSGHLEEQRELISRIMAGETTDLNTAERLLNYPFSQTHHSAIIWSEEIDTEISDLESLATAFQKACHQTSSLKIIVSPSVIWVWASAQYPVNEKVLEAALKKKENIRLSHGDGGAGIDGFRRSHLDAQAAQRVLGRLKSNVQLVSYDRVRLMAFLSKDAKSIQHYSGHVLGDLAQAPAAVRHALHAFLECGCNATEAAKRLHTHRNTLLRRLAKAEEMLPRPLAENRIQVAVALEALYWIL